MSAFMGVLMSVFTICFYSPNHHFTPNKCKRNFANLACKSLSLVNGITNHKYLLTYTHTRSRIHSHSYTHTLAYSGSTIRESECVICII